MYGHWQLDTECDTLETMKKTARLGLRVTPLQKSRWEIEARRAGYSSTAAWITAMLDWITQYEAFSGSYEEFIKQNPLPSP